MGTTAFFEVPLQYKVDFQRGYASSTWHVEKFNCASAMDTFFDEAPQMPTQEEVYFWKGWLRGIVESR